MSSVSSAILGGSLFQITTGKKHQVCGNGFVIYTKTGLGLALTPFSTRIAPNGRDTNLSHQAKFENGFSIPLFYIADHPGINFALAVLNAKGAEKKITPAPLSFNLPMDGAPITCFKPDGLFHTSFGKPMASSDPSQFLFGALAPSEYIGGAVVHEGMVIGLVSQALYSPAGGGILGMRGGTSLRSIFEFLVRGAQGDMVHPDGFKYNLDPKISAIINQLAETLSAA